MNEDSRLLVIVTRMYAPKGKKGDEYTQIWNRAEDEPHFSPMKAPRGLLVVHGHSGRSNSNFSTSANDATKLVANTIEQFLEGEDLSSRYDRALVLYHPGTASDLKDFPFKLSERSPWKDRFHVEVYSGTGYKCYSEIEALAQACKDDEPNGKEARNIAFDDLWECVLPPGIPLLEAKLSLLHKLLVPPAQGSGEWDQINEDWEQLIELVKDDSEELQEDRENYNEAWLTFMDDDPHNFSDDPFNEEYCGAEGGILGDLRDGLLSTAS